MGTRDEEHWREYALTFSPIGKQKYFKVRS